MKEIDYGENETVLHDDEGNEYKVNNKYIGGKVARTEKRYVIQKRIESDQDELAAFIQYQRECKGSTMASFRREVKENGNRYVVKEWRV